VLLFLPLSDGTVGFHRGGGSRWINVLTH
jgi:hypothetical protein